MKLFARFCAVFVFISVSFINMSAIENICFAESLRIKQIKTISKVNNFAVIDWYEGSSDKIAVAVQDLHSNYSAQKAYAPFLSDLFSAKNELNIQFIGVEGTSGLIDTSFAYSYPEKNIKKTVSDRLLKNGFITGFEYFAVNHNKPVILYGIDDRERYIKNSQLYFRISRDLKADVDKAKNLIEYYLETANAVCGKSFSGQARELYRYFREFHESKISHIQFAEYLKGLAVKYDIDLSGYDQFNLLFNLRNVQSEIDPNMLDTEKIVLLGRLKPEFSKTDYSKLFRYNMSFSAGQISATAFYSLFDYYLGKYSVKIPDGSNLSKMLSLISFSDSIKEPLLDRQLYSILNKILKKINFGGDTEKLFSITTMLYVMDYMLELKASRWQYDFYESSYDRLSLPKIYAGLKVMFDNPYSVVSNDEDIKKAEHLLSLAQRFYAEAVKRDGNMFYNASFINSVLKGETMVFITGGFHSQGITSFLRGQGISYVVVTPRISAGKLSSVYQSVMFNSLSKFDTMLSPMQTRLIPSSNFNNLIYPDNRIILMAKWAVYAGVLNSAQNMEGTEITSLQLVQKFALEQEKWLESAVESLHTSLDPLVEKGIISEEFVSSRIEELKTALDRVEYDFSRSRVFEKSLAVPLLIKGKDSKEVIVNVKEYDGNPSDIVDIFDNLDIIKLNKYVIEIWPKEAFLAINEFNSLLEYGSKTYSLAEKQNFAILLDFFGIETVKMLIHTLSHDDMKDLLEAVPLRSQIKTVVDIIGIENSRKLFLWDPQGFFNIVYIGSKYDMALSADQFVNYVEQLLSERATFRVSDKTIPVVIVQDAAGRDLTEWFSYGIDRHFDLEYWSEVLTTNEIFLKAVSPTGEVIGLLSARYHPEQNALVVDAMETSRTARRTGVGRALIKEVVNISMQAGYGGRIVLLPLPDAKAFYKQLGFELDPTDSSFFILTSAQAHKLFDVSSPEIDGEQFSVVGHHEKILELQKIPIVEAISRINELMGSYEIITYDDLLYIAAQLMRVQSNGEKETEKIVNELLRSEASFERIIMGLYDAMVDGWMEGFVDKPVEQVIAQTQQPLSEDIAKGTAVSDAKFRVITDNLGQHFVDLSVNTDNPQLQVVIKPLGYGDIEKWFSYDIDHEISFENWKDNIAENTFFLQAVASNGKIVGLALGQYDDQHDGVSISLIETALPVRNYGVAKSLITEMARLSYKAGFNGKIILNSSGTVSDIYKKLGFVSYSDQSEKLILMPKQAYELLGLSFMPSMYLSENINLYDDSKHIPELTALTRIRALRGSYSSLYSWDKDFIVEQFRLAYGLLPGAAENKLREILQDEHMFRKSMLQLYDVMLDSVLVNIQGKYSFGVNILPVDKNDIEEWFSYDIHREFVQDHWDEALSQDNVVFYKALSPSGTIVGLIAAKFEPSDKSFSILREETSVTARFMGVGKSLMGAIASNSINKGYNGILKIKDPKGAEDFLKTLGFQKETSKIGITYTLKHEDAVKLKNINDMQKLGKKYSDLSARLNVLKKLLGSRRPIQESDKQFLVALIDKLYNLTKEDMTVFIDYFFKSQENTMQGVSLMFSALADAVVGQAINISSPMASIEEADEDDLEQWFEYGIPRQIMRMGWLSTIGEDSAFLKAVSPSGRIIGLVSAKSNGKDAYKIEYIETCVSASKSRIGTALVQEIIKLSIKEGFAGKVILDSTISAANFYLNLGFDFPDGRLKKKPSTASSTGFTRKLVLSPDKAQGVLKKNVPAKLTAQIKTFSSPDTIKAVAYLMNRYKKINRTGKDTLTELSGKVLGLSADYMGEVYQSETLFAAVTNKLYNAMIDQQLVKYNVIPLRIENANMDDLKEWFASPVTRKYDKQKWDNVISEKTKVMKVISPTGTIVALAAFNEAQSQKAFQIDLIDTCVTLPENIITARLLQRASHLSFMRGYEGRLVTQTNPETDDVYKKFGFEKTTKNKNMLVLNSESALKFIDSYTFLDYQKIYPEFDRLPPDAVIAKLNSLEDKFHELSYQDKAFISVELIKYYGITPLQITGVWTSWDSSENVYRKGLKQLSLAVLDNLIVDNQLDKGDFTRIEKATQDDIDIWYSAGIDRGYSQSAWNELKYDDMFLYKAVSPSGRILGMVSFYIGDNVNAVQISLLDVCKTAENSSVGKELVSKAVRESFKRGFGGRVVVDTSVNAIDLYRSLGFIELPDRVKSFGLQPEYAEQLLGIDSYSSNEQVLKEYRKIHPLDAIEKLSGLINKYGKLTVDDKFFIAAQIMNVYLLTPSQTEQMLNKFFQSPQEYRNGLTSLYDLLSDSWSARQNAEKDLTIDRTAVRPVVSGELPTAKLSIPETVLPEMRDYISVLNKMIDLKNMLGNHPDTSFDKPLADKPSSVNLSKSFLRRHGIAVDIRILPASDPRVKGRIAVLLDNIVYVNENTTRGEFWFYLPHEISHILDDEDKAQLHNASQIAYLKGLSDILLTQAKTVTDRPELRETLYAMGVNIMYNALAYELDILTAKLQLTQSGEAFLRNNNLPVFNNISKSYLYSVASSSYSLIRPMPLPEIVLTVKDYAQDKGIGEKAAVGKLQYFVMKNIIQHSVNKAKYRHNKVDSLLSSWVDIQFNRRFWQVNVPAVPKQLMPYIKESVDKTGVVDIRDIQRRFCDELRMYPNGTEKAVLEQVLAQWIARLITENITPLMDVNELTDVFQQKQANCSGYSKLFNMIASQFGLNTRIAMIEVEYEGILQLHAVNLVKLSTGKWEILDLIPSGGDIKRVYIRVKKDGKWVHEFVSNKKFLAAQGSQIEGLSQDVVDAVTFNTRATVANEKGDIETALYNMNIAYELDPESPYIAFNLAEMIFANWIEAIQKFDGYPSQEEIFEKARNLFYEFDLERNGVDIWKNFYNEITLRLQSLLAVGSIDGINGAGNSNFYWRNKNLKKAEPSAQPDNQEPKLNVNKPDGAKKIDTPSKSETAKSDDALLKQMDAQGALNRMNLKLDKTIPAALDKAKALRQYQVTQMLGNGLNFNSARHLIQIGGQITLLIQQQQFVKAQQMLMGLDPEFTQRIMVQFPWITAFIIELYPQWWKGDDLKELARKARLPDEIREMVRRQLTTVTPVHKTDDRDEFRRYPRVNPLWDLFKKAQLVKRLRRNIDQNNLTDSQFRVLYDLLETGQIPSIENLSARQRAVLFGKRDEIPFKTRPSVKNGFILTAPFADLPATANMPLYENFLQTVVDEHPHELVSVLNEHSDKRVEHINADALKISRGGLSVVAEDVFESVTSDDIVDFLSDNPQENVLSEIITAVFTSNLLFDEKLFFLNNIIQSGILGTNDRVILSYFKKYYVDGDENTTFFRQASLVLQQVIARNNTFKDELYYLASKLRNVQPANLFYAMLRLSRNDVYDDEEIPQIIPYPKRLSGAKARLLDAAM
ncbi:GNAT family N-acetyltransferase [bacterium]|nr:GNAT family N-acetyltransferase [bacterium]